MGTSDPLLKPEHTISELLTCFMIGIRIVRIGMVAVIELYNVETTSIDVEMNIPFLKVWRDSFPHRHFWMQLFHSTPRGVADAPTVRFG